ncbi:hypothetical protein H5154_01040 [Pseudoalteromonas sp. SR44-5]|nr:hypothetical protein [Pseudoalteromonas sp. SR44-5]MBB1364983.1 hypothetical protein [Pseudoalteromonas sp. SR44-5]
MSNKTFAEVMEILDVIEGALNEIASSVGHTDFETFSQKEALLEAA